MHKVLVCILFVLLFTACTPPSGNSELYSSEYKNAKGIENKNSEPSADTDNIAADISEDWNAYKTMNPLDYNIMDKSIFSAYPLNSNEIIIVFHQKNAQLFEVYQYKILSKEMLFLDNIKEPPRTFQIIDEETFCVITQESIYTFQKGKSTTQNTIVKEKQFDCAVNIKSNSIVYVDEDSNLKYERTSDGYCKLLWKSSKEIYEGTNEIKAKDENGEVVTNRAWRPSFSESGRYIAFTELKNTSKIYIYDTTADKLSEYTVPLNLTNGSIYFSFIGETLLALIADSADGNQLYKIDDQSMTKRNLDFSYSKAIRGSKHIILADKSNTKFYLIDANETPKAISLTKEAHYQTYILTSTDTDLVLRVRENTTAVQFIVLIPY